MEEMCSIITRKIDIENKTTLKDDIIVCKEAIGIWALTCNDEIIGKNAFERMEKYRTQSKPGHEFEGMQIRADKMMINTTNVLWEDYDYLTVVDQIMINTIRQDITISGKLADTLKNSSNDQLKFMIRKEFNLIDRKDEFVMRKTLTNLKKEVEQSEKTMQRQNATYVEEKYDAIKRWIRDNLVERKPVKLKYRTLCDYKRRFTE
nr:TPA_asm: 22 kDa protein [Osteospermum ophiovirus]